MFFKSLKYFIQQTLSDLKYRGIRKYLYLSLLMTFILSISLTVICYYFIYGRIIIGLSDYSTDIKLINIIITSSLFKLLLIFIQFFLLWIFFTYILVIVGNIVSGFFADAIFDELNKKRNNVYKYKRKNGAFFSSLFFSIKSAIKITIINLILFPFYFILPVANIILFILINGIFLGKEFSGNFLIQFHEKKYLKKYFLYHSSEIYSLGCVVTFLYIIPILNLFTPFIANVGFANQIFKSDFRN